MLCSPNSRQLPSWKPRLHRLFLESDKSAYRWEWMLLMGRVSWLIVSVKCVGSVMQWTYLQDIGCDCVFAGRWRCAQLYSQGLNDQSTRGEASHSCSGQVQCVTHTHVYTHAHTHTHTYTHTQWLTGTLFGQKLVKDLCSMEGGLPMRVGTSISVNTRCMVVYQEVQ